MPYARTSYSDESWMILVMTGHGQRDEGGHGGYSDAERRAFILATGSAGGARQSATGRPSVDMAANAVHQGRK